MKAAWIKDMAREMGVDLCGIAPVDRFRNAPAGFHPRDILPGAQSVIVLGKRFLAGTLEAASTIPYTIMRNKLSHLMDQLSIDLAYALEDHDIIALPTGAIEPCEWDANANRTRGIISLKHAAELAGLGRIGKNTLLINKDYGNMIWLSALVTSMEATGDPPATYRACLPNCRLCIDACPVQALGDAAMDQKKCWEHAFGTHNGGEWRIKCFKCRSICPRRFGC